jgi:hypothetical protein
MNNEEKYFLYYGEEKKHFVVLEDNGIIDISYSNVDKAKYLTKQASKNKCCGINRRLVEEFNRDSGNRDVIVRKCKRCGKYFILSYKESKFYESKDLCIPKRCSRCRHG